MRDRVDGGDPFQCQQQRQLLGRHVHQAARQRLPLSDIHFAGEQRIKFHCETHWTFSFDFFIQCDAVGAEILYPLEPSDALSIAKAIGSGDSSLIH